MIFSEIYGAYFNAVAAILTEAAAGTLTGFRLTALVQKNAFTESTLSIPKALKTGRWPLLTPALQPVLRHRPTMPLSTLQKRWMKALLSDPRLALFAPDTEKQEFESRISALFENKWMVDLIDTAMAKIYDYHNNGRLYHEIISKSYLTAFRYTESELLDLLNMERSTFYDRKREAILLLGVSLWGYAIPSFKGIFNMKGDDESGDIPDFFK